jgi:hypothetical protein
MVPWWLLTVAPAAAGTIARNWTRKQEDDARPAAAGLPACVMVVFVATVSALSVPGLERYNPILGRLRPSGRTESNLQALVDRIPAGGTRRIFARLEWGEYLDWAGGAGRLSPFMDGRIEIYDDTLWRQYGQLSAGAANWQAILDRHQVDYLLLDQSYHAKLLPQVLSSPGWSPVARSGPAVLFARAAFD